MDTFLLIFGRLWKNESHATKDLEPQKLQEFVLANCESRWAVHLFQPLLVKTLYWKNDIFLYNQ